MLIKFEPLVSLLLHARKPSAISATSPMPEDFPYGLRGISRLPAVSPLMYSTTEAKLPNPNTRQDIRPFRIALRCRKTCLYGQSGTGRLTFSTYVPTAKPPAFPDSLRSVIQYRCRDFSLSPFLSESRKTRPFHPPQPQRGHNRFRWHQCSATIIHRIRKSSIIGA